MLQSGRMASPTEPQIRILAVLPHFPFDATSRVPARFLGVCSALRECGFSVRLLAVSATAWPDRLNTAARIEKAGYTARILPAKSGGRMRPEFQGEHPDFAFRIVDVGNRTLSQWEAIHNQAFDLALESEIKTFDPDIILSCGLSPNDLKRMQRARKKGLRVIEHPHPNSSIPADSNWSDATCTDLPSPSSPAEVVVDDESAERVCVTLLDPSIANGVYLSIPFCNQCCIDRPEQPILIIASHSTGDRLGHRMIDTAKSAGISLEQYENILISEPAAAMREVWAATEVLVMPSLEPAPLHVVAGALQNGIPVLASDRSGLAGIGGVTIVPLPPGYGMKTQAVQSLADVEPWMDALGGLLDDESAYASMRAEARRAGEQFTPKYLAPRYEELVRKVLAS
jgi:glycosyltransferase involved in cell wall biosynthesis